MSFVRTVLGDVAPSALGAVDYHEHLFQVSPLLPGDELDDERSSCEEGALLREAGISTLVEATPAGLGRSPEALARISASTGLTIVATTGAHRQAHYPDSHWIRSWDVEQLSAALVSDLMDGCPITDEAERTPVAMSKDQQPIRAGLLKAGIGYWSITAFEHGVLEAVATAHRLSGAPVMVHLEHGSAAHEVLDLLESAGVPPDRIVLAHADRNPDIGLHLELSGRGAHLGYDGMTRSRTRTDSEIIDLVAGVVEGGGGNRILLGGDVARRTRYVAYGGMPGLTYLPNRFLPRLRECVGAGPVLQMMVANPASFLTWTTTTAS